MLCHRTCFLGKGDRLHLVVIDSIVLMVISGAIYFLFLIICYFVGESKVIEVWIECVQLSHVLEWTCNI